MRVPRVRFTVRRLMVAVAVVGIVSGAWRLKRRSDAFDARARSHLGKVAGCKNSLKEYELDYRTRFFRFIDDRRNSEKTLDVEKALAEARSRWPEVRETLKEYPGACLFGDDYFAYVNGITSDRIHYHSKMSKKYAHASKNPWLLISPDPPEPK